VNQSNSRNDLNNVMKQPLGPMIRTPMPPKIMGQQQIASPPPAPIYHPGYNHHPNNPIGYDITKTVTSIVDSLEADLAKHVKRRPSGQFESHAHPFLTAALMEEKKQAAKVAKQKQYKKTDSIDSRISVTYSRSVSPSLSQRTGSRSPSPNPIAYSNYNHTNSNSNLNRTSSRSPSPVLQFAPRGSVIKCNFSIKQHQQNNISDNPNRKLPPLPQNKISKMSFKQPDFDDSEFELTNMSKNENNQSHIIQQVNISNNKNITTSKQLPQVPFNQMATVVTPTITSISSHQSNQNLTKKYTSMGDDESDENENWF
jgi:hypothetical protein